MTPAQARMVASGPLRSEPTGLRSVRPARPYFLGLTLYALLIAAYIGLRYGWRWLPGDAATLTVVSQNTYLQGTVTPTAGLYPLGYGYPALNAFLAQATGLPIEALQVYVQPFLIALLVPVSYVAFRALLGDAAVAALACLLLFLQPDFLFESLRGSHAKLTWLLALGMLLALSNSFRTAGRGWPLVRWVALFYLLAYGLIASNVFFASSYIFGLAFAFLGGRLVTRWLGTQGAAGRSLARLLYVTLACSVMVFLFAFYLYPAAERLASSLITARDRLFSFLLDVETGTDPYQYVQAAWLSPWLFLALQSLSWLELALSFANWLHKAWWLLRRRQGLPPGRLLLWLLYTGLAFLLAVAVFLDQTGALSANLQVRLFPHLMIVAIPLAAQVVAALVVRVRRRGPALQGAAAALMAVAVLFFSAASLFKATNEPMVSNRWLFYSPGERAAVRWAGPHLAVARVWLGLDSRLLPMLTVSGHWQGTRLVGYAARQAADGSDLLLSDVVRMQAARLAVRLPDVRERLRVYDNGGASLYHTRPRTPYQR